MWALTALTATTTSRGPQINVGVPEPQEPVSTTGHLTSGLGTCEIFPRAEGS